MHDVYFCFYLFVLLFSVMGSEFFYNSSSGLLVLQHNLFRISRIVTTAYINWTASCNLFPKYIDNEIGYVKPISN